MRVLVESRDFQTKLVLASDATVADVFRSLKLNEDTYLASVDGALMTSEDPLREGATVRLLPVVSGG